MSATTESKESAIAAYVDGILQENLKEHRKKFGADAPVTQERIDQIKYRLKASARELIEAIESKELLYRTWIHGRFHPSNKHSRKLFENLTGVKLPQRVGETALAIKQFLGLGWVETHEAEIQAKRDAQRRERQLQLVEQQRQRLSKLIDSMPCKVSGEQLVELARHVGLEHHPRTIGSARNVHSIEMVGGALRYSILRSKNAKSACDMYRQLMEHIEESRNEKLQLASEDQSSVAQGLFKRAGT
jgi:hypothetical protein